MTFTRRRPEDPPETATEVTLERVAAALASRGYTTRTHGDRVTGRWDGYHFAFTLEGESLVVEGSWGPELDEIHLPGMVMATNDWNRDHLWPVCFTRRTPEGRATIGTRFVVPLAGGLSIEHLVANLDMALRAGVGFFSAPGTPPGEEEP